MDARIKEFGKSEWALYNGCTPFTGGEPLYAEYAFPDGVTGTIVADRGSVQIHLTSDGYEGQFWMLAGDVEREGDIPRYAAVAVMEKLLRETPDCAVLDNNGWILVG